MDSRPELPGGFDDGFDAGLDVSEGGLGCVAVEDGHGCDVDGALYGEVEGLVHEDLVEAVDADRDGELGERKREEGKGRKLVSERGKEKKKKKKKKKKKEGKDAEERRC